MNVKRFSDEYDTVCGVFGLSEEQLRERDSARSAPTQRWVAYDDQGDCGTVDVIVRPDQRAFAIFRGALGTVPALAASAASETEGRLHASGRESNLTQLGVLREAGFVSEMTAEVFDIYFAAALAKLRRAWLPTEFSIVSADEASLDLLLALDNDLRQLVPGTDGWVGTINWLRSEFAESPPYDPAAYLVAIDESTGRYAGLVRVWRNEDGPRLGMVGVLPEYRRLPLAARLMYEALTQAANWGFDTFTAETSLTNRVLHPRLKRFATSTDVLHQMVRG